MHGNVWHICSVGYGCLIALSYVRVKGAEFHYCMTNRHLMQFLCMVLVPHTCTSLLKYSVNLSSAEIYPRYGKSYISGVSNKEAATSGSTKLKVGCEGTDHTIDQIWTFSPLSPTHIPTSHPGSSHPWCVWSTLLPCLAEWKPHCPSAQHHLGCQSVYRLRNLDPELWNMNDPDKIVYVFFFLTDN